jgi:ATP-dependent DNA helicase DinG
MSAINKSIFEYERRKDFPDKLTQWIGDVFYDILPEHGYEVREEQIYTAYQMADTICKNKLHLAEAGLGTGKTFAYLLPAIAYARFSGKPVIIACASTALQEQLCGEKGDIQTISNLLKLDVDARMAKDSYQYVCDCKADDSKTRLNSLSENIALEVIEWLGKTKRGERSEIPQVPDHVWNYIGWDEGMACDMCLDRGFCKLIRAKEYYKAANDLIVVDHDLFFKDLWTRDELILEGKLPILPAYSAVIFDEGHKIILPAAMQAGQRIRKDEIEEMVHSIEQVHGVREALLKTVANLEEVITNFFIKLNQVALFDEQSERYAIPYDSSLSEDAKAFQKVLDQLLLEFQIEQELYLEALPLSLIHAYEMKIDKLMLGLHNFRKNEGKEMLAWINHSDGSFWVVPKDTNTRLDKHLYQKKLPVVLTSATLSNDGDFSYLIRTLGLHHASHSTVGNSFEMENQVEVYLPNPSQDQKITVNHTDNIEKLVHLLHLNQGRALVLTNSKNEVQRIRNSLKQQQFPFELLWEDKAERGYLIRKFKEDITSVLVGYDLWEGIDVPGESLTMVIVWQLPFPALDPLIEEQRRVAKNNGFDPVMAVDYPEMGLKLKQGCGRLIRTKDDQGKIVIMESVYHKPYEKIVMGALPQDVMIKNLNEL